MGNFGKSFALILILIIVISSLILIDFIPFGLAQTGTNENGIISSDTTWNQTGSPYSFTGPVAVNQGVTLTIEAGVTVDIGNYYMQVNGTLSAKGTSANLIYFNGGSLNGMTFTSLSNGWNEQEGTGNIIQNAIINPPIGASSSIKLDHDNFMGALTVGNSSSITNSKIEAGVEVSDEALLSNNAISGAITPPLPNGLTVSILGSSAPDSAPTITNNQIKSESSNIGISCFGCAVVTNNTVTGGEDGMLIYPATASGYPIIDENTVVSNLEGIIIRASGVSASSSPLIQHNLITNNRVGISVEIYEGGTATPTIQNNNIYGNNVNLGWGLPSNLDAPNNWWGNNGPTSNKRINRRFQKQLQRWNSKFYSFPNGT